MVLIQCLQNIIGGNFQLFITSTESTRLPSVLKSITGTCSFLEGADLFMSNNHQFLTESKKLLTSSSTYYITYLQTIVRTVLRGIALFLGINLTRRSEKQTEFHTLTCMSLKIILSQWLVCKKIKAHRVLQTPSHLSGNGDCYKQKLQ